MADLLGTRAGERFAIETGSQRWRYFRSKHVARLWVALFGGKLLGWTL